MITDLKISSEYRDSVTKYTDEQLDAMSVIEIPWEPVAVARMEAHPETKFVVFVRDVRTMAVAAERLGRSLRFDITTLETGRLALAGRSDKTWQDFAKGIGPVAARGVVIRLVTKAIELGNRVDAFVEVAGDILFKGVRASDADVVARAQDLRRGK